MTTKKLTTTLLAILFTITLGLGVTSCNKDDNGGMPIPDNICADFVTFVSTNDQGTVFTFRKSGDSDLITLTAAVKVDTEQIKPGSRVIIQYVPSGGQEVYQSGPITLYGITRILNDGIEEEDMETIASWGHDPINVHTIARSGQYLDLWAEANCGSKPKRFVLVADKATLENEYPELYLIFVTDDDLGRTRQIYASFDLSKVWDLETSLGAKLTYYTGSGTETMTLHKSTRVPLQPGEDVVE